MRLLYIGRLKFKNVAVIDDTPATICQIRIMVFNVLSDTQFIGAFTYHRDNWIFWGI